MRYFKGILAENGNRIIVKKYDEEMTGLYEKYIAEMIVLDNGSKRFIKDIEEADQCCIVGKAISEEEFTFLRDLAILSNEVYLHKYTGGFPCQNICTQITNSLSRRFKKLSELFDEENSNDE